MHQVILESKYTATGVSVLACLFVSLLLFQLFFRGRNQSIKAPLVDAINDKKFHIRTLESAAKLWQHGYQKYPQKPFLVPSKLGTTLVVPPSNLSFLKGLPDSVLSFESAFSDQMMGQHTRVVPKNSFPLIASTIKSDLTPHIPKLNSQINEIVEQAVSDELSLAEEWTTCSLNKTLLRIVSIVIGEVAIGPEHSKDQRYLDVALNYTIEVFSAVAAVQFIPLMLRMIMAPFTSQIRALRKRERDATRFFAPILEARHQAAAQNEPPPDDMMTWMVKRGAKFEVQNLARQAHLQLGITFAAVHTTTTTATSVMYNLAAMPQYVQELRKEAREAYNSGDGAFTTAAIQKLTKLDSFIKETMRFNPISVDAFQRKVLQPFSLPDGTLVPAGTRLAIPWAAMSRDPEIFENPDQFDGYRFVNAGKTIDGKASGTNQFVAMSMDYLVFGFGRHACPGRFFATNLIKIMVATILLRYDLRNGDGSKERYPDNHMELMSMPNHSKEIQIRAAREA